MRFNSGISCLSTLSNLVTRQFLNSPDPDIPELFPNIEGANILEDLGLGELTRVASNVTQWPEGRLPVACYDLITDPDLLGGSCDPELVEVYEVTYDDCEEPWVICRCQDADEDLDRLVTDLGQLPVLARDYVRYVVMSDHQLLDGMYELEGSSVWWEGDLIIYGNWSSVGLFVHEVAHTLDYFVSGNEDVPYSETPEFEEILDADTCVADYYAKTTYSEAYAQAAVLLAFDINRSGPLDEVVDHDCMDGVYDILNEQIGEHLTYNSEATCSTPLRKGANICLDDGDWTLCRDDEDNDNTDDSNNDNSNNNNDDDDTTDSNDDDNTDDSNTDDNNTDDSNTDDSNTDDNNNNNDDDSNTDDSNTDDTIDDNGDDDSAGVRLSMGSVPMAVFWGVAQVFRAVGVMNGP